MKQHKKTFLFITLAGGLITLLSQCINGEDKPDPRGAVYAGAATCRQCHQAIYDQYIATTHFQTSQSAIKDNVHSSFADGHNQFVYSPNDWIRLEARDTGLYQVAYKNGEAKETHRMDIVFGQKHAQTFLFWKGGQTFELPVSYYRSSNSWGTSPGFTFSTPYFNRVISTQCFECHASFVGHDLRMSAAGIDETLRKETIIYGIDCERCHGPGTNHANFHEAYPEEKKPHYMASIKSLQRQQRLDVCAVCHSGNDKIKEHATFGFKPGDTLANYFSIWQPDSKKNTEPDVHGNQYRLLSESQCFQKSLTMNCSTCHNPHSNAGNNLAVYAAACMTCHQSMNHPEVKGQATMTLQNNCVDCHMPLQSSRVIRFQTTGTAEMSPYKLRTHRIAVY